MIWNMLSSFFGDYAHGPIVVIADGKKYYGAQLQGVSIYNTTDTVLLDNSDLEGGSAYLATVPRGQTIGTIQEIAQSNKWGTILVIKMMNGETAFMQASYLHSEALEKQNVKDVDQIEALKQDVQNNPVSTFFPSFSRAFNNLGKPVKNAITVAIVCLLAFYGFKAYKKFK